MSNPENQSQGKIDFDLEPPSTLFRMNWNHGLQFTDLLCIATLNRCEKLLWKFAPGWLWPLATACSNVDLWSEGPIVAPSPGETGGEVWGDSQVIWSCWEEFVEEIRGPTKCGETQIFERGFSLRARDFWSDWWVTLPQLIAHATAITDGRPELRNQVTEGLLHWNS